MDLKSFRNPEAGFRPAPFWSWNAALETKELKRQIRDMADKGWGGFFMHSRVGLITPYLSAEWHAHVKTCAEEAKKTGTRAWLYDEDKWPSGFAGGIVPGEKEAFRMKALRAVPPEEPLLPTDSLLRECVVDGRPWRIVRWVMPLGDPWFNNASYIDTMNKEAVDRFLEVTVDGYKKSVGKYFGHEIPGIFTDEPCYLFFRQGIPSGLLPWTDDLAAEFEQRKGYGLLGQIEKLFFELPGYRRVRHDFFDTATRLFLERFTKNYGAKCGRSKLIFTGHFMAEDTLADQTKWIGAAMPHYEYMTWPGIDKLSRHVQQTVTVKQVSSAADQLGKERAFSEVFGCCGHHFVFQGRRWIHNWEAALGINFVNHHLSLYTMAGERKRDYPPNFFCQAPWWPWEKGLSDYFGRLSFALTRGKRVVDILVLHPVGSVWAEYDPAVWAKPGVSPALQKVDADFKRLTDLLLADRLDFHYGDEILLERHGGVDGPVLKMGRCRYHTVVVPRSLTWNRFTLELLKAFHDAGGKVLFAGPLPGYRDMHEPFNYAKVFDKAERARDPQDAVARLRESVTGTIQVRDTDLSVNAETVFVHERELEDGGRLVFLTNTHEKKTVEAEVRLPYRAGLTILDCETGDVRPVDHEAGSGSTRLRHRFHPGEGLLLLADLTAAPAPVRKAPARRPAFVRVSDWTVVPRDRNVLRVETLDLTLGGTQVLWRAPVFRAWNDHFYGARDGVPFEAAYYFNVASLPAGRLSAVVEFAENLETLECNGQKLKPSDRKWLSDVAFTELDITGKIREGENVLRIRGVKRNNVTGSNTHRRVNSKDLPYRQTELEAVYILGDFLVDDWDRETFAIAKRPAGHHPDLRDITGSGYPFYTGVMSAEAGFNLKSGPDMPAMLQMAGVEVPCVEVRVNGKPAGTRLFPPFEIDIRKFVKKGKNRLELLFPTDLHNLFGPNYAGTGLPAGCNPGNFRDNEAWSPGFALLRKGISEIRIAVQEP